jgi:hypothetical protein
VEDYSDWNKEQLKDRAAELDVEGRSGMTKEELIDAIEEAEASGEVSEEEENGAEENGEEAPEGNVPKSVEDLDMAAAFGGATLTTSGEAKAPKGTEYPEDYPEEDKMPEATTTSSGVSNDDLPLIPTGAAVLLGHGDEVPERYRGVVALVIDAPRYLCNGCDLSPRPHEHQPEDVVFTVRTRDDADTILNLTRASFDKISPEGRAGLLPHG